MPQDDGVLAFAAEAAARAGVSMYDISDAGLGEYPMPSKGGGVPNTSDGYDTVRGCLGSILGVTRQEPGAIEAVMEDCDEPDMQKFVCAAIELMIEDPDRFGLGESGIGSMEILRGLLVAVTALNPSTRP